MAMQYIVIIGIFRGESVRIVVIQIVTSQDFLVRIRSYLGHPLIWAL
jgi:hypothetical protein